VHQPRSYGLRIIAAAGLGLVTRHLQLGRRHEKPINGGRFGGLLQPTSHFELPRSRFVQRPRDQVRSVAVAEFVRERKSLLEELDDFAALVC
jgi:hypothetical protein